MGFSDARVNIQDEDAIGLMKGAGEIVQQRLRASVTVRLEQNVNALEAAGPRGRQRGANFGGMVAVIVDHRDAALRAAHLKAPVDAGEIAPGASRIVSTGNSSSRPTATAAAALSSVVRARHMHPETTQVAPAKFEMKLAGHVPGGRSA